MIDQSTIQGSQQWLLLRKNSVTATDIAKILHLSPYETAYQCWSRKLGLLPDIQQNEAMRRGSELEPVALDKFIKEVGIVFIPLVVFHPVDSWKMASLDGLSTCGKYAVEIKCSKNIYEKLKQGIIDDIYNCQIQWQLYCAGINKIYFAAYWDGEILIKEVQRDNLFLESNMPKIHEFYSNLLNFTPPPSSDKDFVKKDDDEWIDNVQKWKDCKRRIQCEEDLEKALRDDLIKMCDGQSCQGAGLRVSKTITRGRVNFSNIEELKGVDLNKYRGKTVESYRFTEVKDKNE